MTDLLPFVSIIIPCRNEVRFIGACLDSVINNNYPKDQVEILVVDGMSEDGTREVVADYARQYSFIKLVDNPKKITPAALNIGIAHAKGEVIMRMDAHTVYPPEYIHKCVHALTVLNADNVGGRWETRPRTDGLLAQAIVQALSHRFGVGNARYRIASAKSAPRVVDTVPFFCVKRTTLERVGPFNEALARGQDMEFSLRLRRAGFTTLLIPDLVSTYYARSDLRSFIRHNWTNGVWAILPFAYSLEVPVSWRHLVPLAFVLGMVGSAVLSLLRPEGLWMLATIVGSYGTVSLLASAQIAWRERDLRYQLIMPFVFCLLHLGYGLGSMWGVVRVMAMPTVWRRLIGAEVNYGTDRS